MSPKTAPAKATTTAKKAADSSKAKTPAASVADESPREQSAAADGRGFRKTREGIVISDKMDKTVVVVVEDRVKHSLYGKVIRRTRNMKAHDESNSCGVGDRVLVMETRPLSATKRWRVMEIIEKAK